MGLLRTASVVLNTGINSIVHLLYPRSSARSVIPYVLFHCCYEKGLQQTEVHQYKARINKHVQRPFVYSAG